VKPNFIEDPNPHNEIAGGYGALYIGRLSEEKGIKELIREWQKIDYPLKVIGGGPIALRLKEMNRNSFVSFLGNIARSQVINEIEECAFVVVPSIWQEPFGLVNIEALSMGKPLLASRKGGMIDIIKHGENGYFIDINKGGDLQEKIDLLLKNNNNFSKMKQQARKSYVLNYTPHTNYKLLIRIYRNIISSYY
jgi:glycosyltransferase involved in cell wall biosynthesis